MKKSFSHFSLTSLLVIFVLAFILIAATPIDTIRTQTVLCDQPPIALKFVCAGVDTNPVYRFDGFAVFCDSALDIQSLTVYNSADSSHLLTVLVDYDLDVKGKYYIEHFSFGIHGGALRKSLNSDDTLSIVIHGVSRSMVFELNEYGKLSILKVITSE